MDCDSDSNGVNLKLVEHVSPIKGTAQICAKIHAKDFNKLILFIGPMERTSLG